MWGGGFGNNEAGDWGETVGLASGEGGFGGGGDWCWCGIGLSPVRSTRIDPVWFDLGDITPMK